MGNSIKKFIIEIIATIIGSFIVAIAVSFFLLPNELSSGGLSGIATIMYYIFHIPMGTTILILNIPLLLIAILKIGKNFLAKTIIGTITLSFFIDLLNNYAPLTNNKIVACLCGGILTGFGTLILLKANSSTGGSDLAGIIIKKYKPTIKTGTLIASIDFSIVLLNMFCFKNVQVGVYSLITIFIMEKVILIFDWWLQASIS